MHARQEQPNPHPTIFLSTLHVRVFLMLSSLRWFALLLLFVQLTIQPIEAVTCTTSTCAFEVTWGTCQAGSWSVGATCGYGYQSATTVQCYQTIDTIRTPIDNSQCTQAGLTYPSTQQQCTDYDCLQWLYITDWNTIRCSEKCGITGNRTRSLTCFDSTLSKNVTDEKCLARPTLVTSKPETTQTCMMSTCSAENMLSSISITESTGANPMQSIFVPSNSGPYQINIQVGVPVTFRIQRYNIYQYVTSVNLPGFFGWSDEIVLPASNVSGATLSWSLAVQTQDGSTGKTYYGIITFQESSNAFLERIDFFNRTYTKDSSTGRWLNSYIDLKDSITGRYRGAYLINITNTPAQGMPNQPAALARTFQLLCALPWYVFDPLEVWGPLQSTVSTITPNWGGDNTKIGYWSSGGTMVPGGSELTFSFMVTSGNGNVTHTYQFKAKRLAPPFQYIILKATDSVGLQTLVTPTPYSNDATAALNKNDYTLILPRGVYEATLTVYVNSAYQVDPWNAQFGYAFGWGSSTSQRDPTNYNSSTFTPLSSGLKYTFGGFTSSGETELFMIAKPTCSATTDSGCFGWETDVWLFVIKKLGEDASLNGLTAAPTPTVRTPAEGEYSWECDAAGVCQSIYLEWNYTLSTFGYTQLILYPTSDTDGMTPTIELWASNRPAEWNPSPSYTLDFDDEIKGIPIPSSYLLPGTSQLRITLVSEDLLRTVKYNIFLTFPQSPSSSSTGDVGDDSSSSTGAAITGSAISSTTDQPNGSGGSSAGATATGTTVESLSGENSVESSTASSSASSFTATVEASTGSDDSSTSTTTIGSSTASTLSSVASSSTATVESSTALDVGASSSSSTAMPEGALSTSSTASVSSTGAESMSSTSGLSSLLSSTYDAFSSSASSSGSHSLLSSSSTGRKSEDDKHASASPSASSSSSSSTGPSSSSSSLSSSSSASFRLSSSSSTGVSSDLPLVENVVSVAAAIDPCTTSANPCLNGAGCTSAITNSTLTNVTLDAGAVMKSMVCTCASGFFGPTCSAGRIGCIVCESGLSGNKSIELLFVGASLLKDITISDQSGVDVSVWSSVRITYGLNRSDTRVATILNSHANLAVRQLQSVDYITFKSIPLITKEEADQATQANTNQPDAMMALTHAPDTLSLSMPMSLLSFDDASSSVNSLSSVGFVGRHLLTSFVITDQPIVKFVARFPGTTETKTSQQLTLANALIYYSAGDCQTGEFQNSVGDCVACPSGCECMSGGRCYTLAGYWSSSLYQSPIKCVYAAACPGYSSESETTDVCSTGYAGRGCSQCADNYYLLEGRCYSCGSSTDQIAQMVAILIAAGLVTGILSVCVAILDPVKLVYVVTAFVILQQVSSIGAQGAADLPDPAGTALSTFFQYVSVVNFDLQILRPGCSNIPTFNFVTLFLCTICLILFTGVLFIIACLIRRTILTLHQSVTVNRVSEEDRLLATSAALELAKIDPNKAAMRNDLFIITPQEDFRRRMTHSLLILCTIFYLKMCTLQMRMFECVTAPKPVNDLTQLTDDEGSYLRADYITECYVGQHLYAVLLSIVIFVVYTVGFPLTAFILLCRSFADEDTPGVIGWLRQRVGILRPATSKSEERKRAFKAMNAQEKQAEEQVRGALIRAASMARPGVDRPVTTIMMRQASTVTHTAAADSGTGGGGGIGVTLQPYASGTQTGSAGMDTLRSDASEVNEGRHTNGKPTLDRSIDGAQSKYAVRIRPTDEIEGENDTNTTIVVPFSAQMTDRRPESLSIESRDEDVAVAKDGVSMSPSNKVPMAMACGNDGTTDTGVMDTDPRVPTSSLLTPAQQKKLASLYIENEHIGYFGYLFLDIRSETFAYRLSTFLSNFFFSIVTVFVKDTFERLFLFGLIFAFESLVVCWYLPFTHWILNLRAAGVAIILLSQNIILLGVQQDGETSGPTSSYFIGICCVFAFLCLLLAFRNRLFQALGRLLRLKVTMPGKAGEIESEGLLKRTREYQDQPEQRPKMKRPKTIKRPGDGKAHAPPTGWRRFIACCLGGSAIHNPIAPSAREGWAGDDSSQSDSAPTGWSESESEDGDDGDEVDEFINPLANDDRTNLHEMELAASEAIERQEAAEAAAAALARLDADGDAEESIEEPSSRSAIGVDSHRSLVGEPSDSESSSMARNLASLKQRQAADERRRIEEESIAAAAEAAAQEKRREEEIAAAEAEAQRQVELSQRAAAVESKAQPELMAPMPPVRVHKSPRSSSQRQRSTLPSSNTFPNDVPISTNLSLICSLLALDDDGRRGCMLDSSLGFTSSSALFSHLISGRNSEEEVSMVEASWSIPTIQHAIRVQQEEMMKVCKGLKRRVMELLEEEHLDALDKYRQAKNDAEEARADAKREDDIDHHSDDDDDGDGDDSVAAANSTLLSHPPAHLVSPHRITMMVSHLLLQQRPDLKVTLLDHLIDKSKQYKQELARMNTPPPTYEDAQKQQNSILNEMRRCSSSDGSSSPSTPPIATSSPLTRAHDLSSHARGAPEHVRATQNFQVELLRQSIVFCQDRIAACRADDVPSQQSYESTIGELSVTLSSMLETVSKSHAPRKMTVHLPTAAHPERGTDNAASTSAHVHTRQRRPDEIHTGHLSSTAASRAKQRKSTSVTAMPTSSSGRAVSPDPRSRRASTPQTPNLNAPSAPAQSPSPAPTPASPQPQPTTVTVTPVGLMSKFNKRLQSLISRPAGDDDDDGDSAAVEGAGLAAASSQFAFSHSRSHRGSLLVSDDGHRVGSPQAVVGLGATVSGSRLDSRRGSLVLSPELSGRASGSVRSTTPNRSPQHGPSRSVPNGAMHMMSTASVNGSPYAGMRTLAIGSSPSPSPSTPTLPPMVTPEGSRKLSLHSRHESRVNTNAMVESDKTALDLASRRRSDTRSISISPPPPIYLP